LAADAQRTVAWQKCLLVRLAPPLVGLAILLGFGLRVFRLGYQALWLDELYSLYQASFPVRNLWQQLTSDPINFDQTPLYYLLLAIWVRLAGGSEFAIRFVSVLCGVLALPVFYKLLRLRVEPVQALAGTAILAVSSFAMYYSQEARMHALALLLGLLAAYALLRGLQAGTNGWWWAYGLAAAAETYTFYYAVLVLVAINLPVLLRPKAKSWKWTLANLAVVGVWLPWLALAISRAVGLLGHRVAGLHGPSLTDYVSEAASSLAFGSTLGGAPAKAATAALGLIALAAGARLVQRGGLWDRLMVAYALIPALAVYLLTIGIPVFYPRYLLASLPGWIGMAVAGWPVLPKARWLTPALGAALFLAPTGLSLANSYANPAYERIDYTPAMDVIRQQALPDEAIVYDSPNPDTTGGHFLHDQPLPAIPLPVPGSEAATDAQLASASQRYAGLWVLLYGQLDIDRANWVESWLDAHELPVLDRSFGQNWYRLKHYRPAPKPLGATSLAGGFSVDAQLGPLHLLQARAPALAAAFTVDLLWTVDQPLSTNEVVSLQLLDQAGRKAAQLDSEPFLGGFPTSQWKPGLAYADAVQLKPGELRPGTYTLQVGVYPAGKPEQAQQITLGSYKASSGQAGAPFERR
jgi:hypothetical protein